MKQYLLKIAISAGVLTLLSLHLEWQQVLSELTAVSLSVYLLALAAMVLQILMLTWRWMLFVNSDRDRIGYFTSLRITVASLLANVVFVTSVSGVLVKIAITSQYGLSLLKSICAAIADRIMTLGALILFALIFLPYLPGIIDPQLYFLGLLLVFGFAVLLYFTPIFLQKTFRDLMFLNRKVTVSFHYARSILTNHSLLARLIIVSLLAQLCYFLAVELMAHAMNVDLPFLKLLAVLPIMTLVASLPVGFGGWGIREGAFVYGLGLIGVPAEAAFLISVQIGLLSILSVLVVGVPALVTGDASALIKRALVSRYGRRHMESS